MLEKSVRISKTVEIRFRLLFATFYRPLKSLHILGKEPEFPLVGVEMGKGVGDQTVTVVMLLIVDPGPFATRADQSRFGQDFQVARDEPSHR